MRDQPATSRAAAGTLARVAFPVMSLVTEVADAPENRVVDHRSALCRRMWRRLVGFHQRTEPELGAHERDDRRGGVEQRASPGDLQRFHIERRRARRGAYDQRFLRHRHDGARRILRRNDERHRGRDGIRRGGPQGVGEFRGRRHGHRDAHDASRRIMSSASSSSTRCRFLAARAGRSTSPTAGSTSPSEVKADVHHPSRMSADRVKPTRTGAMPCLARNS